MRHVSIIAIAVALAACAARSPAAEVEENAAGEGALRGPAQSVPVSPSARCHDVDGVERQCVYKAVGGLELGIDVFRPAGTELRPAILWIHGGALLFGNKSELPAPQRNLYLDNGFVVASVDYRLAPETKLDEINQDISDAYGWLRANAQALGIDAERIAVIGHSAGAYLTLDAGARLSPPPKAIVSFYGYGDVHWYQTPMGDPSDAAECPADPLTAYPAGAPVGESGSQITSGAGLYEAPSCPMTGGDDDDGPEDPRQDVYGCSRAKGYWPEVVGGKSLASNPDWFAQFEPKVNITAAYPPTLLLHGTIDDDVPFSQSQGMLQALQQHGVEAQLVSDPSWQHMFDGDYCDPTVQCAFSKVIAFLGRHLGGGTAIAAHPPACSL